MIKKKENCKQMKHKGIELRPRKKEKRTIIKGWLEYGKKIKEQNVRKGTRKSDNPDA